MFTDRKGNSLFSRKLQAAREAAARRAGGLKRDWRKKTANMSPQPAISPEAAKGTRLTLGTLTR